MGEEALRRRERAVHLEDPDAAAHRGAPEPIHGNAGLKRLREGDALDGGAPASTTGFEAIVSKPCSTSQPFTAVSVCVLAQ